MKETETETDYLMCTGTDSHTPGKSDNKPEHSHEQRQVLLNHVTEAVSCGFPAEVAVEETRETERMLGRLGRSL